MERINKWILNENNHDVHVAPNGFFEVLRPLCCDKKPGAVMGVDPGAGGGVAVIDGEGSPLYAWGFSPKKTEWETAYVLIAAFRYFAPEEHGNCFMEKVGYMPHDGGKGSFTFGLITGFLRGVLVSSAFEPKSVYPMLWQSRLKCLSRGNKNVTKRKAQQLFPGVKVTHAIADALLIAEYGRRVLASS